MTAPPSPPGTVPADITQIRLPVALMGSGNVWLLDGSPLTLVDTGPATQPARAALEAGLSAAGVRVEDLERILLTHHHIDHTGLCAELRERSGAEVCAIAPVADRATRMPERIEAEQRFIQTLMTAHGWPGDAVGRSRSYWDYLRATSVPFAVDRVLRPGERIAAGRRDLRVVHRPGHSRTDTLFVDDAGGAALVGDHLLDGVSPACEIVPPDHDAPARPRPLVDFLDGLARTAELDVGICLSGHGPPIADHARLIERLQRFHERRLGRLETLLAERPRSAHALAVGLFGADVVAAEPVLTCFEVFGHLDVLRERGQLDPELIA